MTKLKLDDLVHEPIARARIEEQADPEMFGTRPMPSRHPITEGQINIRAELEVLDRFKQMCRIERRTYGDMLSRLMKAYGQPKE